MMSDFVQKVLEIVQKIPKGKVTTYREVARALGVPKGWRAVGQALSRNPHQVIVPCHRVIRSDGRLGGYKLGIRKKIQLLTSEGIEVRNGRINLKKFGFRFHNG